VKIARIGQLHGDFGWRTLSFLKIATADGVVGWSEYYEGAGNRGLTAVIQALGEGLIGADPREVSRIVAKLHGQTIQAPGGLNQQAIGAMTNALLDIKAKALGVPVHALYGGAIRDRLTLYWSHCASYRARYPKELGLAPPRNYDDLARIGAEVRERGFKALKTTILLPVDGGFRNYRPTTGESTGFPELNLSPELVDGTKRELAALREGSGPSVGLMLDVNFFFKPEGFLRLARALEPFDLLWLEMDSYDPEALADVRRGARVPIASCEHLYQTRGYRPFLDAGSVDVAIVDPIWNGFAEAMKIAALAESYEINVAPHNYYGFLSDFITANFAAAISNLRIMETDIDAVPWRHEFYTHAPEIAGGEMAVPTRPGWGTDINEAAVRARPPRVKNG
jgi:galactonate dehydratase